MLCYWKWASCGPPVYLVASGLTVMWPPSCLVDFIVLKLVYKALHDKNWPNYLALEKRNVGKSNLRSMGATTLKVPRVVGTFQENSAKLFNKLPPEIRETQTWF